MGEGSPELGAAAAAAGPLDGHVAVAVPESHPGSMQETRSALKKTGHQAGAANKKASLLMSDCDADSSPMLARSPTLKSMSSRTSGTPSSRQSRSGTIANMGIVKERSIRASFADLDSERSRQAAPPDRYMFIRYAAMLRWSRWGLFKAPLAIASWLVFVLLLIATSHTQTSFFLRSAMTDYVANITADLSRGVPLDRIVSDGLASTETGARCRCSCAPERNQALCQAGTEGRATEFKAQLNLRDLTLLRERSRFQRTPGAAGPVKKWDDLRTQSDVWFWVQHGFLPEFWKEPKLDTPTDFPELLRGEASKNATSTGRGIVLRWNQFVGGVRMRQMRLMESTCTVDKRLTDMYDRTCHELQPALEPFGPGLQSYTEGFMPEQRVKGAFDVHFDFEYGAEVAAEKMQHVLKEHGWLDSSSDMLLLQAVFLNAQAKPPMLGVLQVSFNFQRGGAMEKHIDIQTIPIEAFNHTEEYVLLITWLVLLFLILLKQLHRVWRYFQRPAGQKPSMLDVWTMGDWATLVFSICLVINHALLSQEIDFAAAQASSIPAAPMLDVATVADIRRYHEIWDRVLDQFLNINVWGITNRIVLFAYAVLLTFQFLQLFRAQPKMSELGRVLLSSLGDLFHFVVVFLVLFLNFAFTGFLIYGVYLEEWSTGLGSINASLQLLFGLVDLERMFDVAPKSTVVWFVAFVCCLIFVMMNILVAITLDNFESVKAKGGTTFGLFSQLVFAVRDQARRGWGEVLCCCCRQRRRDASLPRHKEMLQEMFGRCGISAKERADFDNSVINTKYNRQSMEKAAFAAETHDATDLLMARQMPVDEDFEDMGVDTAYARGLCKDARKYAEADYDLDEQREGQLREIVSLSYDVMTDMRERIGRCQEYSGDEMSGLARRLEALEIVVHRSLEELVKLADGAMVSTKGEPAKNMKSKARMDSTVGSLRSLDASTRSKGMMTGALQAVLEKLADSDDAAPERRRKKMGSTTGSFAELKVRTSTAPPPPADSKGKTFVDGWHRTSQKVSVVGKRLTVSAREEWANK